MTHDVPAIADEIFASALDLASVPGIAYGIVHEGRLVHSGGYGAATVGGATPAADTVFRIASMTKSFTAAAVLMLRDDGLLRLDDPIAEHLPAARSLDEAGMPPVTIRDLLTMVEALPPMTPEAIGRSPWPSTSSTTLSAVASRGAGRRERCSSTATPGMRCWGVSSRPSQEGPSLNW